MSKQFTNKDIVVNMNKKQRIDSHDFALIADNLPDFIARYDVDARIVYLNIKLCKLLNVSLDEVRGRLGSEAFPDGRFDEYEKKILKCARTGIDDSLDMTLPEINGRTEYHHLRIVAERNTENQIVGVIALGRDMTDRVYLEQKIVSSSRLASLGEMAGGIAHEINNPLAVIEGKCYQLNQLSSRNQFTEENVRKLVSGIELTTARISKVIRGLKNFSRDAINDPFSNESLIKILGDSLSFCEQKIKNSGITLKYSPDLNNQFMVKCRAVEISQVIINLLNNALDALTKTEQPSIKIDLFEDNAFVHLVLEDNGSGIPQEIRNKIMEPFFTTKPVGVGTGLGLSISKGIIAAHGGDLLLMPETKKTQFVVKLPKAV